MVFVFSGDTGVCDTAVELARDADVFLCGGVVDPRPENRPPADAPVGNRAGQIAARTRTSPELLLTHIPPWTSRGDVISEAKAVRRTGARRGLR